jgi:iron complex outermembrane recepter protein
MKNYLTLSAVSSLCALATIAHAQEAPPKRLEDVVVTATRSEQRRFDAAASIDAVPVDTLRATSPLVNLSELTATVPGVQARERQNYAQDLQLSVRGFGTRSTFGVRGVRLLIDGIPATMPDGQGQAASASLTSASRIEVLRGPVAQLYGNSAGGVVQVFTKEPPLSSTPVIGASLGAGSYDQRHGNFSIGGGTEGLGGLLDVSHYKTDGYRDHSAAARTQLNAKLVARPSSDTTLTGIFNNFNLPRAQDPLGLTHAQFEQNPRQVVPGALIFDTRKRVEQQQAGVVVDHKLSAADALHARLYGGTRQVFQTLAFSGSAPNSAGGVVDLDNSFRGAGLSWSHKTKVNALPLNWTLGIEADQLDQTRRGYVNNNGTPGDLRRDELDTADNLDVFGQIDWRFLPQWTATAGARASRVKLAVDDHYVTAASPNDSGSVEYKNTSPQLGLAWHANEDINVYGNIGRGFETPTLVETAYRVNATGPNLSLKPSKSRQGEIGMKWRAGRHAFDAAVFASLSRDEIVPLTTQNGRAIFQNVDEVERRGIELSWKADWDRVGTQVAYTLLDARFGQPFVNGQNATVAADNQLPGAPRHSLFTQIEYRPRDAVSMAAEMRAESKAYVDDVNSDAAPGYAVFNLRAGYEFRLGAARMFLYGRLDNLFDRNYAGSLIVNDGNQRFFEPAAGRRLFVGLRGSFQ